MKIHLFAIGSLKSGPLYDLQELYRKRLTWNFQLHELPAKKFSSSEIMKEKEGELLLKSLSSHKSTIVTLDERGKDFSSQKLADWISEVASRRRPEFSFIIGGADGLHPSVLEKSDLVLSFGKATWPHLMVRIMLLEQLYRIQQILKGHPYHRD
jgi:23S rRNA (pseudouridine1915-N3)-methyltransferase